MESFRGVRAVASKMELEFMEMFSQSYRGYKVPLLKTNTLSDFLCFKSLAKFRFETSAVNKICNSNEEIQFKHSVNSLYFLKFFMMDLVLIVFIVKGVRDWSLTSNFR